MTKEKNDVISNEEHARRMDLYRAGLSDREMAEKLFLSRATIHYWRKKHNLPSNSRQRRITQGESDRMMELYRQGLSDKKIARQVGRAACTVGNWRARNGLKPHYRKYGGKYVAQD